MAGSEKEGSRRAGRQASRKPRSGRAAGVPGPPLMAPPPGRAGTVAVSPTPARLHRCPADPALRAGIAQRSPRKACPRREQRSPLCPAALAAAGRESRPCRRSPAGSAPGHHVPRGQPLAASPAGDGLRDGRAGAVPGVLRGEDGELHHRYQPVAAARRAGRGAAARPQRGCVCARLLLGPPARR